MWEEIKSKILYGADIIFILYIIISLFLGASLDGNFLFMFIVCIIINVPFLVYLTYVMHDKMRKFKKRRATNASKNS